MSDFTKSRAIQPPIKSTIADSLSRINVLDDEWQKLADEHGLYNISLDETARAMWQEKMSLKILIEHNLDKSINSYMCYKRLYKLG